MVREVDLTIVIVAALSIIPLTITAWASISAAKRAGKAANHTEKLNSGWAPEVTKRLDEIKASEIAGHKHLEAIHNILSDHIEDRKAHSKWRIW